MCSREADRSRRRDRRALPSTRGPDTMLNLPGDVVTMLIVIPLFLLLPLLVIFIAYRIIKTR